MVSQFVMNNDIFQMVCVPQIWATLGVGNYNSEELTLNYPYSFNMTILFKKLQCFNVEKELKNKE